MEPEPWSDYAEGQSMPEGQAMPEGCTLYLWQFSRASLYFFSQVPPAPYYLES